MTDTAETAASHDHDAHQDGEHEIHMPPNSWVPINVALATTLFFIGFLTHVLGPTLWIVGLVWLIAACAAWARAATTEYRQTPD